MELTPDDAGAVCRAHVGDEITVVLEENPTTGYRWQPEMDTTRLQLISDEYEGPQAPVGAGGTRRLTFSGLRPGPAQLHLVKRRAWEQSAVAEYDVTLDIATD